MCFLCDRVSKIHDKIAHSVSYRDVWTLHCSMLVRLPMLLEELGLLSVYLR